MKRLYFIFLFAAVAISGMAQNVGEAFYIYRNDGGFNAFFRDEVDSIAYSHFDADSVFYDEIVTQLVYTQDSIYRIPLAAVDSVGFVQPETVYKENVKPIVGDLFNYLIKANGQTLVFDTSLPVALMPHKGEKLVATDVTDKLPCGFVGQVQQVTSSGEGIVVQCDSIGLGDAVTRFYGVYDIAVGGGTASVRGHRKAPQSTTYPYELPFGRTQLPPISLSGFVQEKNIFDINCKNELNIAFTPDIRIKVTRIIDDNPLLAFTNHTNLFVVTDADVEMGFDVSGEAAKEWSKSFLPKQDFLIPPGVPLYFDLGVKASLSGEIASAFTINSHVHQVTDITYYDVSLLPEVGQIVSPLVNRVDGTMDVTTFNMNWDYLGFRAELKPCVYMRVGLSAISHVAGWVGVEADGGAKMNGELMFDFNRLRDAEPGTAVYDELKDFAKIDIKPYAGVHLTAAAFDDRYIFQFGEDFENPLWTWYQGRILPGFSDTKATRLSDTRARVTANVTNDCFIPYTVGFALYDENKNHVKTELYSEKYWTRNAFGSYTCEFDGLDKTKKYKVYPVIRFFGKYDMLASPSTDLIMDFPVTLSDFKVTKSQHDKGAFYHDGVYYDYRFDVSVTATLDDDADDISDWGYVYMDPNGREAYISLRQFGRSYTDTRYAYFRNQAHSTCTLYGYVKYVGSDEYVYGEPHDYPLDYAETSCPDENHPHWIDLGIGTLWRCCNEGASSPEGYGGYYTIEQAQAYNPPSLEQIKALLNKCAYTWTIQNGVWGGKFTGPNGGTVFLPAAGYFWNGGHDGVRVFGYYWSSTPDGEGGAYFLYFESMRADCNGYGRYGGQSVRPVR